MVWYRTVGLEQVSPRIFHAVLSVVGTTINLTLRSELVHLSRLHRSNVRFHQALDLMFELDEVAVRCTRDILRQRDFLDRIREIPWVVSTFVVIEGEVNPATRQTIDQSTGGKLRDRNARDSWALLEDLALYDNESLNDPRDLAKLVKAISLP
ncbi:hypothetical protein Tco_1203534 [Tanacetum coccineum]